MDQVISGGFAMVVFIGSYLVAGLVIQSVKDSGRSIGDIWINYRAGRN